MLQREKCGTCNKDSGCNCVAEGLGAKSDSGKLLWNLLPVQPVRDIVEILTFGANKYGPNNWQEVSNARARYVAALLRHVMAWMEGEKNDPETGKSHLAHAGCNLFFLLWIDRNKKED